MNKAQKEERCICSAGCFADVYIIGRGAGDKEDRQTAWVIFSCALGIRPRQNRLLNKILETSARLRQPAFCFGFPFVVAEALYIE